eukprot:CAMPEP_0195541060 /NCGR_PEP_ID=MMETSP0794_2-20130614/50893_1 /TAXON_ID=515487 /ORGANISM="Stephanopyxis turris, Strain CCMP 815" /LENGTH=103 /DNA_ID=CAMNT_0040675145 /DNA_START=631 /DNA_END=939 /DNA_ORIENTATION=-
MDGTYIGIPFVSGLWGNSGRLSDQVLEFWIKEEKREKEKKRIEEEKREMERKKYVEERNKNEKEKGENEQKKKNGSSSKSNSHGGGFASRNGVLHKDSHEEVD